MKYLKQYRNQLLFTLIGIFVGFFIERFTHIDFKDKVDPISFANLILTLVIALLLALFIQPSNESARIEKNLHIEQLKEIKEIAKNIHNLFVLNYGIQPLNNDVKQSFISQFRNLSNQIDFFFSQTEFSKNENLSSQKKIIIDQLVKYKSAITGGSFNKNNFIFKSLPYNKYDNPYKNFSKKIIELIILGNK